MARGQGAAPHYREEPKPPARDTAPSAFRDKAKDEGVLGEARLKEKTKENPEKEKGDPAKLSNGNDSCSPARDPGKKDGGPGRSFWAMGPDDDQL